MASKPSQEMGLMMAKNWKQALKDLGKEPPPKNIVNAIIPLMQSDESDRSVALNASSLAEIGLVAGIAGCLHSKTTSAIEALFWDSDAPFGTFSRRTVGAVAFGFIGPKTKANLDVIRHVRNTFAHSISEVNFASPAIKAACEKLILSDNAKFFVEQETKRRTRFQYCYACDDVFRTLFTHSGFSLTVSGQPLTIGTQLLP